MEKVILNRAPCMIDFKIFIFSSRLKQQTAEMEITKSKMAFGNIEKQCLDSFPYNRNKNKTIFPTFSFTELVLLNGNPGNMHHHLPHANLHLLKASAKACHLKMFPADYLA